MTEADFHAHLVCQLRGATHYWRFCIWALKFDGAIPCSCRISRPDALRIILEESSQTDLLFGEGGLVALIELFQLTSRSFGSFIAEDVTVEVRRRR